MGVVIWTRSMQEQTLLCEILIGKHHGMKPLGRRRHWSK